MSVTRRITPEDLADDAARAVLSTQWEGLGAVRVDGPPGPGKTRLVEDLSMQSYVLMGERVMAVVQTNEQAFDLTRRLARRFPARTFHLFARKGLAIPADITSAPNVFVVHSSSDLPNGPSVTIANGAKWSWIRDGGLFDLQVVDEAFQLPDFRFQLFAGLASRVVLVGDPGQIAPVITCEIERWRDDPAGPHVPCPEALLVRHPDIRRIPLPISRRLVPDTVAFVQPAFYPDLSFQALSLPGERELLTGARGISATDRAIDLAEKGASIVLMQLPPRITGEMDEDVVSVLIGLARRLLERGARVRDGKTTRPLEPGMIGIVCAHVSQVNAVQERLPTEMTSVLVETSDRFQGLEREVMLVYHPLSGRSDGSAFHLDAGRLCVMMSRHRTACFVVLRGGVEEMLERYAPTGTRALGIPEDEEFRGWMAHLDLLLRLGSSGRLVDIKP